MLQMLALRQPSESPTQSESWTTPVAGMASPRFSWAADMVGALESLDPPGFHHGNQGFPRVFP